MRDALQKHPEVWTNESYRKLAVDILVQIGANMILKSDMSSYPYYMLDAISILENYVDKDNSLDSTINCRVVRKKLRDLRHVEVRRRDLLKFYRKIITCSCLKKMHLEARKNLPKLGWCYHCKEEKERFLLMVCSSCMVAQYCSKECQILDSPEHREDCDEYVEAHHENTMANNNT